jgi:Zn-dependent protease with chaperone function
MSTTADALPHPMTPRVERWPSETALFVLVLLASLATWALLVLSIVGAVYGAMIALFLFFSHVVFITHIRGSGVRLGPEQFPELWQRVVELSRQAGLEKPPEAYVVQAGGSLNAFATKLFRGRMIVLFAELLDACEGDDAARDMVIGHEIGHLRLGHLDWFMLTAPGRFIPFLGAAYSRACELSCDRWGAALCGDREGAARGLAILAAGGKRGAQVNLKAFVAQRETLDTGWMTLGQWLSTYPPLSARIEAIEPALGRHVPHSTKGPTRAAFLLASILVLPSVAMMAGVAMWVALMQSQFAQLQQSTAAGDDFGLDDLDDADFDDSDHAQRAEGTTEELTARANTELAEIAAVLREHHQRTGKVPEDFEELGAVWSDYRDTPVAITDPFDGYDYGYSAMGNSVVLMSSGPDSEAETDDDIELEVKL